MGENAVERASLASMEAYVVPAGGRLIFRYGIFTTDGFMRGDIYVVLHKDEAKHLIAHNVPVHGTSLQVQAIGDYAKLFPKPIPVTPSED